jgi:hypothetical protein
MALCGVVDQRGGFFIHDDGVSLAAVYHAHDALPAAAAELRLDAPSLDCRRTTRLLCFTRFDSGSSSVVASAGSEVSRSNTTVVQMLRIRAAVRSSLDPDSRVGLRAGRLVRSSSPGAPSARALASHFCTVWRLIPDPEPPAMPVALVRCVLPGVDGCDASSGRSRAPSSLPRWLLLGSAPISLPASEGVNNVLRNHT